MSVETAVNAIEKEIEKLTSQGRKSYDYIQGKVVGMVNAFRLMGIDIDGDTFLNLLDQI